MAVDGAEVAKTELFKEDVREEEVFRTFLDLVSQLASCFPCELLDKFGCGIPHAGVGRMRLQRVEVAGDGSDILIDRPFVIVEDDDELLGSLRDVVEGLECRAAGECCVTSDGDDVAVILCQVACGGHAEGGGKCGSSVPSAVAVMLGLGAEEETIQAFVSPDRVNVGSTAGQHLVNVALVGDIEYEVVLRRREHPVHGDAQLDNTEVRAEVAAGAGE